MIWFAIPSNHRYDMSPFILGSRVINIKPSYLSGGGPVRITIFLFESHIVVDSPTICKLVYQEFGFQFGFSPLIFVDCISSHVVGGYIPMCFKFKSPLLTLKSPCLAILPCLMRANSQCNWSLAHHSFSVLNHHRSPCLMVPTSVSQGFPLCPGTICSSNSSAMSHLRPTAVTAPCKAMLAITWRILQMKQPGDLGHPNFRKPAYHGVMEFEWGFF